ncbi:MAG: DUF4011 domain-containing protein [Desulfobacteraceae bacterium]|nr:DUF4011 domain-containing protein [Desulfobacteraceae bacterium]MBC2755213.1 DUF4011 domain-containing protein [Desulfobacteraceae bacterium]
MFNQNLIQEKFKIIDVDNAKKIDKDDAVVDNQKIVKETLDRLRTKLLDITRRNNLISFRPLKNCLQIAGAVPNHLYERLVVSEKSMELMPLKNCPKLLPYDDKWLDHDPDGNSLFLPVPIGYYNNIENDSSIKKVISKKGLQTLFQARNLEQISKKIHRCWKTGIEESGINYLFLAVGFLYWCEKDDPQNLSRAPLFLIPIQIEKKSLNKETDCYTYAINYNGEDLEFNLSLAEKLKQDFGLLLPELTNESTPKEYLEKISEIINAKENWRVTHETFIGLFSFKKIRLYKDLNHEAWPDENSIINHPIVRMILIGKNKKESCQNTYYKKEYEIDDLSMSHTIPLTLDADSSQHSAIIDVISKNKNLVIEGPPGGGKSQTIANLITAALYENKTVLFIADKNAAREVVSRRLKEVGIGDFCLELHNHKTQKGRLYADIERRLKRSFPDSLVFDNEIQEYQRERDTLRRYYFLLQQKPGATGENIHEIIWAAAVARENLNGRIVSITISDALQWDTARINKAMSTMKDFGNLHQELPAEIYDIWNGFEPDFIMQGDEKVFCEEIESIQKETDYISDVFVNNMSFLKWRTGQSISDARVMSKINTDLLRMKPALWDDSVGAHFIEDSVVAVLNNLIDAKAIYQDLTKAADKILRDHSQWEIENINKLCRAVEILKECGFGDMALKDLSILQEKVKAFEDGVNLLIDRSRFLNTYFLEKPSRIKDLHKLNILMAIVDKNPVDIDLFTPKLCDFKTTCIFEKARKHQRALEVVEAELTNVFNMPNSIDEEAALQFLAVAKNSPTYLSRLFSGEFRLIKNELSALLRDRKLLNKKSLAGELEKLVNFLSAKIEYEECSEYQEAFGNCFKGLRTNWEDLNKAINWSHEIVDFLGSDTKAAAFLSSFSSDKEQFLLTARRINKTIKEIEEIAVFLKIKQDPEKLLSKYLDEIKNLSDNLFPHARILQSFTRLQQWKINEVQKSIASAKQAESLRIETQNTAEYGEYFGPLFNGVFTDTDVLSAMAGWVNDLKEKGKINKNILEWALKTDSESRINIVIKTADALKAYFLKWTAFIEGVGEKGRLDREAWQGGRFEMSTFNELSLYLARCIQTANHLVLWSDYCRARRLITEIGIGELVTDIENNSIRHQDLEHQVAYSVYSNMLRELFKIYPELGRFHGAKYDNIKERLNHLDTRIKRMSQKRVAHRAAQIDVPNGISSGYIRDYTELSLINHELTKKKRHLPIRQLLSRAGNALQALKPCFMMSPLSVAQYLTPGEIDFDLVIMDEASQLKLEDAIGAVARGKQVVVVGDPKQLPPTTFFEREIDAIDEEEKRTAADDAESILDVCQNCFSSRRLRWHYRSVDENLIAFSNKEFYDNDLVFFPSPQENRKKEGVRYHYIDNGLYHKGRNKKEAIAVANAVLRHFKDNPRQSLGVATFNIRQRDLILDELEKLQKNDHVLEKTIKQTEETSAPFFVKNLENVQGDERDVIFVSTTYGKDNNSGVVHQRFGPINKDTGWRRLNVIITRAKRRIEIFSSMRYTDIRTSLTTSRGIAALRSYLEYAENQNQKKYQSKPDQEVQTNFEKTIYKLLVRNGYRVKTRVGMAGSFIDLGVYHPDKKDSFIMGIECDGAQLELMKTIKDHEILKDRVLKSKGWHVYRIWSAEWIKNPEKETARLLQKLEELVNNERAISKFVNKEKANQDQKNGDFFDECVQFPKMDTAVQKFDNLVKGNIYEPKISVQNINNNSKYNQKKLGLVEASANIIMLPWRGPNDPFGSIAVSEE